MAELRLSFVFFVFAVFVGVLVNGDFFGSFKRFWPVSGNGGGQEKDGMEGKSFSSRRGYYDGGGGPIYSGGDPYMMSSSSQRGWGWGGWGHDDNQNLDLYSLLGGLSFASLLGATIIYLARRNSSGRRRRSADGLSYLEDDEMDWSEDPETKGLNIVELIDTFLDNRHILFANEDNHHELNDGRSGSGNGSSRNVAGSNNKSSRSFLSEKIHLGPGIVPHQLSNPVL